MPDTLSPLLYQITFYMPDFGRKPRYLVSATNAAEAIETGIRLATSQHGKHHKLTGLQAYSPRWVDTDSVSVDALSPKALAYYQAQAEALRESE